MNLSKAKWEKVKKLPISLDVAEEAEDLINEVGMALQMDDLIEEESVATTPPSKCDQFVDRAWYIPSFSPPDDLSVD